MGKDKDERVINDGGSGSGLCFCLRQGGSIPARLLSRCSVSLLAGRCQKLLDGLQRNLAGGACAKPFNSGVEPGICLLHCSGAVKDGLGAIRMEREGHFFVLFFIQNTF